LRIAPWRGVADQTSPLATPRQEAKTGRLRLKVRALLKAKGRSSKPRGLLLKSERTLLKAVRPLFKARRAAPQEGNICLPL